MSLAIVFMAVFSIARNTAGPLPVDLPFNASSSGEGVAVIHASCASCDWGTEGREAVALRVLIDGKYSQHVLLARGDEDADYHITLGRIESGEHRIRIEADPALSAKQAGAASVSRAEIVVITPAGDDYVAQSMAPVLFARPDTVGRFTDLPVFMWYEIVPVPRGRQFRYSVIFTNEDGGTATDRLMATWGRTTDIEFVYGVTLDRAGKIVAEEFQGPRHEVPLFRGRHEAAHPLLWVSTDNNMVSESGATEIRYAPAPQKFDLTGASREVVMDEHPWIYTVAAQEMARERKLVETAAAGSGHIPDLNMFVYVEACTDLRNAAVAFSVHARDASGAERWFDSDRGLPQFRIVRTGCFRGAVPLPPGAAAPDAVRFKAYPAPPPREGEPPRKETPSVTLRRVNRVFTVDEQYQPRASTFTWTGSVPLAVDGQWYELAFPQRNP